MTTPGGPRTSVSDPAVIREVPAVAPPPPSMMGGSQIPQIPGNGFITGNQDVVNHLGSAAARDLQMAFHEAGLFGSGIADSLKQAYEAARGIADSHKESLKASAEGAKHAKETSQALKEGAQAARGGAGRIASGRAGATTTPVAVPVGELPKPAGVSTSSAAASQAPAAPAVPQIASLDPIEGADENQFSAAMTGGWTTGRGVYRAGAGQSSQVTMGLADRALRFVNRTPPRAMQGFAVNAEGRLARTDTGELATPVETDAYNAAATSRNLINSRLSGVAGGAGITSLLGSSAKYLGYAGMAYEGVTQAAHFAESQRAQNAQFQSIYGGSNLGTGLSNRAAQAGFGLSMFGTMSGQQANELFMGVSQMGLQGQGRQDALDFAVSQFKQRGMDISQSLQLINTSINSGVSGFQTLNDSIAQVATAAEQGGRNVSEATQQFNQMFSQLTPQFGGQAATTISGNLTALLQKLPRELSGIPIAGLVSDNSLNIAGQPYGLNADQMIALAQSGPQGLNRFWQINQNSINRTLVDALPRSVGHDVGQMIQQMTGGGKPTEGETSYLVTQLMGKYPQAVQSYQAMLASQGMNVRDDQAARLMIEDLGKNFNLAGSVPGSKTHQQIADFSSTSIMGHQIQRRQRGQDLPAYQQFAPGGYSDKTGYATGAASDIARELGFTSDSFQSNVTQSGTNARLIQQYANQDINRTGRRSKAVESLLSHALYGPGRTFDVTDAHGKMQTVSFEEALHNHRYYQQLASGTALIESGQNSGQTVADVTGFGSKQALRAASQVSPLAKQGGGQVQITMDPNLRQWFRLSGPSSYIDQSQRSGTPAPASIWPGQLPTGQG